MKLRVLLIPLAVMALVISFIACGDDDGGDAAGGDGEETEAPAAGNDGGGGFGAGTGTLIIGDETWEITGVGCVFSAEEAQNPDFPFNLVGTSESSTGERLQLSAEIYDPTGQERHEGDGVTHQIEIYDFNFESPTLNWSSVNPPVSDVDTVVTVDGKTIHGEGVFVDQTTDEIVFVPGTMEVTCS